MPTYYAAGVTTRLSLASLAASTTANATIRGGKEAQNNIQAAEWTLQHGKDMRELDVRCFDEDGRLHFIGKDGEVPFLCVAVNGNDEIKPPIEPKDDVVESAIQSDLPDEQAGSKQHQPQFDEPRSQVLQSIEHVNEDSSLTSLGSTPANTPGNRSGTGTPPIGRIPKYNTRGRGGARGGRGPGGRGRGARGWNVRTSQVQQANTGSSPLPDLQPLSRSSSRPPAPDPEVSPNPSLWIKLKAGRSSTIKPVSTLPSIDPLSKQSILNLAANLLDPTATHNHITRSVVVTESNDEIEPVMVKALTLTTQLSTSSFTRRTNGCSEDLKIDVFFNGMITGCAYISQRDKSSSNALTLRFSGRRTHRVLERAWVFNADVAASDGQGEDKASAEAKRQKRWSNICALLRTEANTVGFDEDGNRPPSGDVLESLAKMPLPEPPMSSSDAIGARFGVIDLIITLGEGKKFGTSEGYLTIPRRLQDTQFKARDFEELEDASVLMPPPAIPNKMTPVGENTKKSLAITTTSPTIMKEEFDLYAPSTALTTVDAITQLRAELDTTSEQISGTTHTPTSMRRTISPGLGSWSNRSVRGRKQPVPPILSPTAGREVPSSAALQAQVPFAVVIPRYVIRSDEKQESQMPNISETLQQRADDAQISPATEYVIGEKKALASQITATQSSKPRALPPVRRLGRSPLKPTNVASLLPTIASLGNVPESHWLSQVISLPRVPNVKGAAKSGVSLKLRLPSPELRRNSSVNVFEGPSNDKKASRVDSAFVGTSVEPDSAIDKPSLKRKVSKTESLSQSTPKQKKRKLNNQVKTGDVGSLSPFLLPSSSSSPTKQMPPPWSSPSKQDEFVVPELCEDCCISYAEPVESNHGGTRQIRKERGGTFREREVLLATRFIVGW